MSKDKIKTSTSLYDISTKIKLLRTSNNISQERLGEMVGVKKRTISSYENDNCFPSIEVLTRISNIFGVSTDELLGIDNSTFEQIDYIKLMGNIVNISHLSSKDRKFVTELIERLGSDSDN